MAEHDTQPLDDLRSGVITLNRPVLGSEMVVSDQQRQVLLCWGKLIFAKDARVDVVVSVLSRRIIYRAEGRRVVEKKKAEGLARSVRELLGHDWSIFVNDSTRTIHAYEYVNQESPSSPWRRRLNLT